MSKKKVTLFLLGFLLFPLTSRAAVNINEIMYDLDGTDTDREWVEIYNSGASVDLTDWKFFDGSNHVLNKPPQNGGVGSMVIGQNGFVVLAANAEKFLQDHPGFSGTVIDTVMSLNNTGDTLKLIDPNGAEVDSVTYNSSQGANGDGNSLQKSGSAWTPGVPTPGTANLAGQQGSQNQNQDASSPASSSSSGGQSTQADFVIEKNIFAEAGPDKTLVVGNEESFYGKALGFKKEPIEGARFLWSFGDGSKGYGQTTSHAYKYPGEYVVVLNVSYDKYAASDRLIARVVSNPIIISEINPDFVKISNPSGAEKDISNWIIKYNGVIFKLPETTIIMPNNQLIIPNSISGFKITSEKEVVSLLYPNEVVAYQYLGPNLEPTASTVANEERGDVSKTANKKTFTAVAKPNATASLDQSSGQAAVESRGNAPQTDNLASVVYASPQSTGSFYKWLIPTIGFGLLVATGYIYSKRQKPTSEPVTEEVEEFTLDDPSDRDF